MKKALSEKIRMLGANTIKLEYYDGSTWHDIAGATALSRILNGSGNNNDGSGSYSWTVTDPNSSQATDFAGCKVRITDTARVVTTDESNNPFTIKAPAITVTSPNGGERWANSIQQTIAWTYSDGGSSTVNVQYSTDSGSTWNAVPGGTGVSKGTGGSGSLFWTPTGIASTTCRIKVTDTGRQGTSDSSNADFMIGAGAITVTSPIAGNSWYANTTHNITWTTTGTVYDNLTLQYSADGGSTWSNIVTGATNSGAYAWTIPYGAINAVNNNAKIKISDATNASTVFAMLIKDALERRPGARVVHDVLCSKFIDDIIIKYGGVPVECRVGHTFIAQKMLDVRAALGGELSGHYYFAETHGADDALFASIHLFILFFRFLKEGRFFDVLLFQG